LAARAVIPGHLGRPEPLTTGEQTEIFERKSLTKGQIGEDCTQESEGKLNDYEGQEKRDFKI
jgi:hypothetical protein